MRWPLQHQPPPPSPWAPGVWRRKGGSKVHPPLDSHSIHCHFRAAVRSHWPAELQLEHTQSGGVLRQRQEADICHVLTIHGTRYTCVSSKKGGDESVENLKSFSLNHTSVS